VLPNTELGGIKIVAEKLRLEIEQMNLVEGREPRGPRVTVSIGCAEFDMKDMNPETILSRAKHALQKAKETGKNRVCS
jgi:two-component system chemotaxis family response regulator WspR